MANEGGERRRTGAAPPGRLRSAVGSRLASVLLSYRLLRGAPRVYFRGFIDKVELIDGGFVRADVSVKGEPIEDAPEEAVDALKRAGRALADAEIVEGMVQTVYTRSALAHDLLMAILFLRPARRSRRRAVALFAVMVLRNFRYAMPGLGTAAIRRAELDPWEDNDGSYPISIREFGRVLRDNSATIILRPEKVDMVTHKARR